MFRPRSRLSAAVNVSAAWHLCRTKFGGMKERGWAVHRAAGQLTGAALPVDGGWTAQ